MLRPCQYRRVTEGGQLVCAKIGRGRADVTADICAACPVAEIDCSHLRFTLERHESGDIIVHHGNGRTEVWPGEPPSVHLQRAACHLLAIPVAGSHTCADCVLRSPMSGRDTRDTVAVPAQATPGAARGMVMPPR